MDREHAWVFGGGIAQPARGLDEQAPQPGPWIDPPRT
jgi:hypothetical protein